MSAPGAALRAQAARSLVSVLGEGRSLKAELANALPQIADVRDRALFEAICFAAVRHRRRYEYAMSQWLQRPLPRREFSVHCLLLVGLAQIDELKLSAHAAVAATAEATRVLGRTALVGLVNALLRRATREALPVSADLAERSSHPDWLVAALMRDWPEDAERVLAANNQPAPLWLRVNPRVVSREAYYKLLPDPDGCVSQPAFPAQALRIDAHLSPEALPGWRDGSVAVQDGAAQLAVEALAPQTGERVLDACAAPGGKSAQIIETIGERGHLLALDIDERRLRKVRATLRRLQLEAANIALKVADASDPSPWWDGVPFDAVLLDAPCSATGIIRRQPDVKWHRREDDIPALVALQARLLEGLWAVLKPGGRLLYSTCSVLREENAGQIAAFLRRHADARALPLDARFGRESGAGRQRLPGEDGMDGFFYALLAKPV
ncbi:16S rRNA (cytosine(967)-C(5))-methyltransferase RsmB [Arenimonas oryziterrae]|uniref:16S rRNA (cytosine(967)-C(5))-methyltransferase n=1 Tax=Arenimonas oryziterrae DSM 21050 = YC6267 TaxID=1121015 RepID=A0A091AUV0_9GAMM|nr:16S rRNA (cytosine(967)-C(5))-methyltransferase RsmB [Arenimonas oryziterrae]KFN44063.1 hypothetical protein N789_06515 [Arenimonas oryziterrae DSM 21050 = YC6267]